MSAPGLPAGFRRVSLPGFPVTAFAICCGYAGPGHSVALWFDEREGACIVTDGHFRSSCPASVISAVYADPRFDSALARLWAEQASDCLLLRLTRPPALFAGTQGIAERFLSDHPPKYSQRHVDLATRVNRAIEGGEVPPQDLLLRLAASARPSEEELRQARMLLTFWLNPPPAGRAH
jgi:hypothetical protein